MPSPMALPRRRKGKVRTRYLEVESATSLERIDGLILVGKDFEQIQQTDHLEGLRGELARVQELQRAPLLFRVGVHLDHQPDAAGVDHAHFPQIQDDAVRPASNQIVQRATKTVHGYAKRNPAAEL